MNGKSMSHSPSLLLFPFIGIAIVFVVIASAQSSHIKAKIGSPSSAKALTAPGMQQHDSTDDKINDLSRRLDSELKAANDRYEVLLQTTERDFHAIELIVVLGSLFVGIVVGWATYREVQQRNKERAFYEAQTARAEERQEATHNVAIRYAEQQVSRSGDILSGQIENMTKLGGVMDLINKTFDKQLTTLTQLDQLKGEIAKLQAAWTDVAGDYEKKYSNVEEIMAPFKERNRIEVSRLSLEEAAEPNRALAIFQDIPEWFLAEKESNDRFKLANLHYLLGQAAYYAGRVTVARDHFDKAIKLYGNDYYDDIKKKLARAFSSHYLGLIEKNWCPVGIDKGTNLHSAKDHLQEAWNLLKTNREEFLTPVTLCEVCSYSSGDRATAVDQLGTWQLGRFDDRTVKFTQGVLSNLVDLANKPKGLDQYQSELLTRGLLIRGNIEFLDGHVDSALAYFNLALQHDSEAPYALLSMAQSTEDGLLKRDLYSKGLESLQNSGALAKRENSSKVLALVWAIIAAFSLGNMEMLNRYLKEFKTIGRSVHEVAKRRPLFFCPITKELVLFEELVENLGKAIGRVINVKER